MTTRPPALRRRSLLAVPALGTAAALLAACKSNGSDTTGTGQVGAAPSTSSSASLPTSATAGSPAGESASAAAAPGPAGTLNLGFFPNLTHAPALVGLQQGLLAKALGTGVTLKQLSFNAGPDELAALLAGSLDIAFIGPSPTITGFEQSKGAGLKVIAGACSGGAALVVSKAITSVAQLKGRKVGSPQLGNTQDVALRYYLKSKGLSTTAAGGGDVPIVPAKNSVLLQSFQQGEIAGAWVPEPYASQFVVDAGGHVLVDEASLWPGGRFVTTNVIVRTAFLTEHPDIVSAFLQGEVDTIAWMAKNPAAARTSANAALKSLSGKALDTAVLERAWKQLTFTTDPLAATLKVNAQHAVDVGLAKAYDLSGLYDLGPLNAVLTKNGQPEVQGL